MVSKILTLLGLIFFSTAIHGLYAQDDIDIVLSSDKDIYLYGEPIMINTTVKNVSDRTIAIDKSQFDVSSLDIKDTFGNPVLVSKEESESKDVKIDLDNYVVLKPNETFRTGGNIEKIPSPGRYYIGIPVRQAKVSASAVSLEVVVKGIDDIIKPLVSE
jgi:hypothetical protein